MDLDDYLACSVCHSIEHYLDYDIMGGCETHESVFCIHCNSELDQLTGLPVLPCMECKPCIEAAE